MEVGGTAAAPLEERVAALPPVLAHRVTAAAEAPALLEPFCRPGLPADVLEAAQAHCRACLLGRMQRYTAAQAAPYCVQLDVGRLLRRQGRLEACVAWLRRLGGRCSVELVLPAPGARHVPTQAQLSLLGQLLTQLEGCASAACIDTLAVRATAIGEHFDAGILAPFCRLRSLHLHSFASADLSQLPASVQKVELSLPNVELLWRSFGEAAEAHQRAVQAQLAAAGRQLAAAEAAAAACGAAPEPLPAVRRLLASARATAAAAVEKSAAADAAEPSDMVRPAVSELAAALTAVQAARRAAEAAAAMAPPGAALPRQEAGQPQLPAAAGEPVGEGDAAAGEEGDEAAAVDVPEAVHIGVVQQAEHWVLDLMMSHVEQGTQRPLAALPPFQLAELHIVGASGVPLQMELDLAPLLASTRVLHASAGTLHLRLPARAGHEERRPWWRLWGRRNGRQPPAQPNAMGELLGAIPPGAAVSMLARLWVLRREGSPGGAAGAAAQPLQLTAEEAAVLVRRTPRPPGVAAKALLRDGYFGLAASRSSPKVVAAHALFAAGFVLLAYALAGAIEEIGAAARARAAARRRRDERMQLQQ
ncbi:hypothetical protein ABPG75_000587 [Micractinium tetrahymenae]